MRVAILAFALLVRSADGQQLQNIESRLQAAGNQDALKAVAMLLVSLQPDAAFQPAAPVRLTNSRFISSAVHPAASHVKPMMSEEDALAKLNSIVASKKIKAEQAQNKKADAIFSATTLRADYSADGDKHGIFTATGADWIAATVQGYALYLEEGLKVPYLVRTGNPNDIVVGTVQTGMNPKVFQGVLEKVDDHYGFEIDATNPIIERDVATVAPFAGGEEVEAYVYCQPRAGFRAPARKIASGDWLLKGEEDGNQISGFSAEIKSGTFS